MKFSVALSLTVAVIFPSIVAAQEQPAGYAGDAPKASAGDIKKEYFPFFIRLTPTKYSGATLTYTHPIRPMQA